tara:strand:+ start:57 stop:257 length:201 start_codon:yes stop_codon:yes gene_type:complete
MESEEDSIITPEGDIIRYSKLPGYLRGCRRKLEKARQEGDSQRIASLDEEIRYLGEQLDNKSRDND